ncbi:hypothetical protein DL764_000716 [Monosporascus ibericus]|uniref:NAD(P)-binding domain-containing protein n=1 Tax=Monosporascus ibericus TaxID=155417 RepID=A0A4Q4TU60_9PEZI|nr:hypothetical protein DL764_000716 [Monosporascus ibericus]
MLDHVPAFSEPNYRIGTAEGLLIDRAWMVLAGDVAWDIDDADSLETTTQGMDAVFFILTQAGAEMEQWRAKNVMAAVQASNSASTIIFSSALWAGEQETFPDWGPSHAMYQYWIGKHRSEEIVREAAGTKHWIIVRPAMFLQNFVPPISRRLFPDLESRATLRVGFKPEDKINVVDAADVGLLAAAAVSRPEQYSGRVFELSLPPTTVREIADKMTVAKGLGPVGVEYVDADELARHLAKLLFDGVSVRMRFLNMRARGIPIMEPYSPLLGHLPLMKHLGQGFPSDAHRTYINVKIVQDWKLYFPTATKCPPVVYIDLWPIMPWPFILITSPQLCSQLTQETPQPRHAMFKWAQIPLTGGLDLLSVDQANHKLWRSRLNPGFSSRNLRAHMPALVEEVEIFATALKDSAGADGSWSDMFTLYDKTIALTFDIIMRISMGLRIHEQTSGPEPVLVALRTLISCCKFNSIRNRLERLTPGFKRVVSHNTNVIRDLLYPQVISRLSSSSKSIDPKTVVDLAINEVKESNLHPDTGFIDSVIANLKIFLFAGHDTTAQTLSWVFYEVNKSPAVLARLRAEHDEVFGEDTKRAKDILLQDHYKLSELRYTSAVIRETLRLHTPAGTIRQASPGFQLVQDGTQWPTHDAVIQTVPAAIHVHPDLWPRPTDFIPERFLVSDGHALYPVKNAFRPFELGSTRCIGEELAMMEMKLALLFTVRELDFDVNYALWDKMRGREEASAGLVDGQRAYRSGQGMGQVKDNLPTRVRMRLAS